MRNAICARTQTSNFQRFRREWPFCISPCSVAMLCHCAAESVARNGIHDFTDSVARPTGRWFDPCMRLKISSAKECYVDASSLTTHHVSRLSVVKHAVLPS